MNAIVEFHRRNKTNGEYEFSFLSNFYMGAPFLAPRYECKLQYLEVKNEPDFISDPTIAVIWPSVEHYYQAAKTNDRFWPHDIRQKMTCHEAYKFFRQPRMETFIRRDWEAIKLDVMRTAIHYKFQQNPALADRLLDTGDAWLVEGNDWNDTFWGYDERGHGKNWLGNLLMAERAYIRSYLPNMRNTNKAKLFD